MKQCPVCKASYADDSLSFCLDDGSTLFSVVDEQETRVVSSANNPLRVNIARDTSPVFTPPATFNQTERDSSSKTVGLLIGLLVIVILAFIGFAAFMLFKSNDGAKSNVKNSPTPTISQTPDDETVKLKEKTSNLERQVEDLKNRQNSANSQTQNSQKQPTDSARVNSPNDGFLALRSEPSADSGYRITQIPHGTRVQMLGCQSYSSRIGSRTGRWCQVSYDGQSGWAFDAFLDY